MIRFVDLGRQLDPAGPRMFSIWDDAPYSDEDSAPFGFLYGCVAEAWPSWEAFANDIAGTAWDKARDGQLDDVRALCPPWVAGPGGSRMRIVPPTGVRPMTEHDAILDLLKQHAPGLAEWYAAEVERERWIPVGERLPERGHRDAVLIHLADGDVLMGAYDHYDRPPGWCGDTPDGIDSDAVTHWKAIVPPPIRSPEPTP